MIENLKKFKQTKIEHQKSREADAIAAAVETVRIKAESRTVYLKLFWTIVAMFEIFADASENADGGPVLAG